MLKFLRTRFAAFLVIFVLVASLIALAFPSAANAITKNSFFGYSDGNIVAMNDAVPDGRSVILVSAYDTYDVLNPRLSVTTTAYTSAGHKLWVVDQRNVPLIMAQRVVFNKDTQKFRPGTIMESCFRFTSRLGDGTTCVKSKV